jgi:hypothetical protein
VQGVLARADPGLCQWKDPGSRSRRSPIEKCSASIRLAPGRRPVEVALCAAAMIDEKPFHSAASRWATLSADWRRQNSNAAFVQVARNQISLRKG